MRYDLVRNETVERRIDGRAFHAPALESPWAVQGPGQMLRLGEAALDAGGAPAVLFARDGVTAPWLDGGHDSTRVWEASILADGPQPVRLATPAGTVRCDAFGFGSIRVEAAPETTRPSAVHVRCTRAEAPVWLPRVEPGQPGYAVAVEGAEWAVEERASR